MDTYAKWGNRLESQMVPFDDKGNQMSYPDPWFHKSLVWTPNSVFADTLMYKGYGRGRSAAYFNFTRTDGTFVSVFMADMDTMIPHMRGGYITGTFTFVKRGQNYGCRLLEV